MNQLRNRTAESNKIAGAERKKKGCSKEHPFKYIKLNYF